MRSTQLPAGFTLGILGGGQLGMFTALAATELGIDTLVLVPPGDNPAEYAASACLLAPYDDPRALEAFRFKANVVTLEFENIPLSTLQKLEKRRPVRPSSHVLHIAQDRLHEKRFFDHIGVPTNRYAPIKDDDDIRALESLDTPFPFPAILKTRRNGYDGKGQKRVRSLADLDAAWRELGKAPCILEATVPFAFELSVITARGYDNQVASYPPIENTHEGGILRTSRCPGPHMTDDIAERATAIAETIAVELDIVGLIAVELFALPNGELLVNEIAPRPHNSGHGTIDACETSQFEQLVRAVCALPLGPTTPHHGWLMRNLIGNELQRLDQSAVGDSAFVHNYGKREWRPGRKMGHITALLDPW